MITKNLVYQKDPHNIGPYGLSSILLKLGERLFMTVIVNKSIVAGVNPPPEKLITVGLVNKR